MTRELKGGGGGEIFAANTMCWRQHLAVMVIKRSGANVCVVSVDGHRTNIFVYSFAVLHADFWSQRDTHSFVEWPSVFAFRAWQTTEIVYMFGAAVLLAPFEVVFILVNQSFNVPWTNLGSQKKILLGTFEFSWQWELSYRGLCILATGVECWYQIGRLWIGRWPLFLICHFCDNFDPVSPFNWAVHYWVDLKAA